MAAEDAVTFDDLCLATEILRETNPIDPQSSVFKFDVSLCGCQIEVMAGSSFEAALKACAVFWRLGLLNSGPNSSDKVQCTEGLETSTFTINLEDGFPRVVLKNILKVPDSGNDHAALNVSQAVMAVSRERTDETAHQANEDILHETLRKVFGFTSFRSRQHDIISASMSGENVLAILGTGGGKSLTFMLPAVLARKPTIVLSPTRALIQDLHDRSQSLGLSSCTFIGGIDGTLRQEQIRLISNYMLVYATPEALDDQLVDLFTSKNFSIERIVFDEAHTICSWGSTFRPQYREVCERLAKANCPKLLLSATTPMKVQQDLKAMFGETSWKVIAHTVYRENLHLIVKERGTKYLDDVVNYVKSKIELCGIIYCVLPNDVSKLHAEFLKRGIHCAKYHGQLSVGVRQANFDKWMSGEVKLIIANLSFGMGIDKSDVRYVIHLRLPTSIEDYFQQCGRAGRDNQPAECILYYSYSDKSTLYKLFDRQGTITEQHFALNELISCLEDLVSCRHKLIMEYFGEEREDFSCLSKCDNCLNRGAFFTADGTNEALKVLQTVVELRDKKCSCNMLKLILSGSKQKKIQEKGFDELANFGCLSKTFTGNLLDRFLHQLILEQILQEAIEVNSKSFVVNVVLGTMAHNVIGLKQACTKFVHK